MEDFKFFSIAKVVSLMKEKHGDLGKIQLQKLIYFLQVFGLELQYKYQIYHYGPFSFDLSGDIDRLETLKVIDIQPDKDGYGFHIRGGKFLGEVISESSKKYEECIVTIEQVVEKFGGFAASQLELFATIHFVNKVLGDQGNNHSPIIKCVSELKPKFTEQQIEDGIEELHDLLAA